ncbi:UPF0602 protein C4orf47-like [Diorhabda sublineata]|uniref:UPF0602 protein C4orf47-like n=1 Tax=Diorhabda sublineata TaxID=1163346 RepID=UPI0024E0918A|nr:UPF0602 protein C4orf47-like [Diorhabda sublineata]
MPKPTGPDQELGAKFGRPDLERVGLFSEMSYLHGAKYAWQKPIYLKGANMIGECSKIKAGKADCYFEKEFKRIFTGESIKGRGRKPPPMKFKNISESPFMPTGETKKHSTPGDYYGTFNTFEHFSPVTRKTGPYKHQSRNFVTSPGKKGGFGYNNICINPYPAHSADKYAAKPKYKEFGKILNGPMVSSHYPSAYFDKNPYPDPPNIKPGKVYVKPKEKAFPVIPPGNIIPTGPGKLLGGCKCGGFDKFPEYKSNKYFTIWDLDKPKKHVGGVWLPQPTVQRSLYTCSVSFD